jgi:N-acetylglucosaminyldiphosphoundecaprenol N-acetyl-beta-D-mannosaminyltransferase
MGEILVRSVKEPEIPAIAAAVRETAPDFLFLGMGSPMKERLADEWAEELGARVIQGVGGSFDVMAGVVKRAPQWVQRCGIEWLYRVIQEPRRMFWRYMRTNGSCLWVFCKAFGNRWFLPGGQGRTAPAAVRHSRAFNPAGSTAPSKAAVKEGNQPQMDADEHR